MISGTLVAVFIHNLFLFDTAVTLLMFGIFAAWAAVGEMPEASGLRRQWIPASTRRPLRLTAPVLVGLVVLVGVYGINMRTYRAAHLITETG